MDLPIPVRRLFWDTDVRVVRWDRHREAIIGRVLADGTWVVAECPALPGCVSRCARVGG